RDRDEPLLHVDDAVLVDPVVAGLAALDLLLVVDRAGAQAEVAPRAALDPWSLLAEPLREVRLPDVRGLHDVVVDADDLREVGHGGIAYLTPASGTGVAWRGDGTASTVRRKRRTRSSRTCLPHLACVRRIRGETE